MNKYTLLLIFIIPLHLFSQKTVELVKPVQNFYVSPGTCEFEWFSHVSFPQYEIQVSNSLSFSNFTSSIIATYSIQIDTFSVSGKYFWRVRGISPDSISQWSDFRTFSIFKPTKFPSCTGWFDASQGITLEAGSKISSWLNMANPANSAVQTNNNSRPVLETSNELTGKNVVKFNGAQSLKYSNPITIGSAFIIENWTGVQTAFPDFNILVSNGVSGSPSYIFLGHKNSTNIYTGGGSLFGSNLKINNTNSLSLAPLNSYHICAGYTNSPSGFQSISIGSNYSNTSNWNGNIAEILTFSNVLSDSEISDIYRYFQCKYSNLVNLGHNILVHYGFKPEILNAGSAFSTIIWSTGETSSNISVSSSGTYSVSTTDIFGFVSSDTIQIIYPKPKMPVSGSLCMGDTLIWDLQMEGPYSYLWSNGYTGSILKISQGGLFSVKITDTAGYSYFSDTLEIVLDSFPDQVFLGPDTSICSGNTISVLNPLELPIHSYLWSTGSTQPAISVQNPGNYSVTVTSSSTCIARDTIHISISGLAPTVNFTCLPVCLGDSSHFVNLSSISLPDQISSFEWKYNGLVVSTEENPVLFFNTPDTFLIELKAITSQACANVFAAEAVIHPVPDAIFTTSNNFQSCLGNQVKFNDLSEPIETISSWVWNFGDGQSSDIQNPVHTYSYVGNFNASLSVQNNFGCTSETSNFISIVSSAELPGNFTCVLPKNDFVTTQNNISFSWNVSSNAVSYQLIVASDVNFENTIYTSDTIYQNQMEISLNETGNYYWFVKAFNICGQAQFSDILYFQIIEGFNHLSGWFDPDSNLVMDTNNNILSWSSRYGNSVLNFPGDTAKAPDFKNQFLNNHKLIFLDGINDKLVNNTPLNIAEAFIIANWKGANLFPDFNCLLGNQETNSLPYIFSANKLSQNLYVSGGSLFGSNISINNSPGSNFAPMNTLKILHGSTLTPNNYSKLTLGSVLNYTTRNWKGEVAEIILFDSALTSNERFDVYNYLRFKYTPPVNLGFDKYISYGFDSVSIDAGNQFTSYLWNTGDTTQSIRTNNAGNYSVTVTDIFGFTSSDDIKVVYPEIFTLKDTTICLGDTLVWSPKLKGPYFYLWNTGENSESISFASEGSYFVQISDTSGNSITSDTLQLTIDKYAENFSLGPDTSICSGNKIYLLSGSEETQTYLWNDGSNHPYLIVSNEGNYSLIGTNSRLCQAFDTINISIQGLAPSVNFTCAPVCLGDSSHFVNLSSISLPDQISSFEWKYNGLVVSTEENPVLFFNTPDTFLIELKATTSQACANVFAAEAVIHPVPDAIFTTSNNFQSCLGNQVKFNDLSEPIETISSWVWNFGDGQSSDIQNPVHTYSSVGNFDASLSVENNFGCTSETSNFISIVSSAELPGNFTCVLPKNNFVTTQNNISFSWNVSSNAVSYQLIVASDLNFENTIYISDTIFQNQMEISLNETGNYYWFVKAFNICGQAQFSDILYFQIIEGFNHLSGWFDPDSNLVIDANNNILSWSSRYGNSVLNFPGDTAKAPDFKNQFLNNHKLIFLDGINDKLVNNTPLNIAEAFIIANWKGANLFPDFNCLLGNQETNSLPYIFLGNKLTQNIYVSGGSLFGSNISINNSTGSNFAPMNTLKILHGSTLTPNNYSKLTLGSVLDYTTRNWKGEVAEIILFDSALTSNERFDVYNYLRFKYTPPVNLGFDKYISYGFDSVSIDAENHFTHYLWSTGDTTQSIRTNKAGTYSVTVTDIFGFVSSDDIKVTYPEIFTLKDTTICLGDTLVWSPKLKGSYTYLWNTGENSESISFASEGSYFVQISDTSGNSITSDTLHLLLDYYRETASLGPDSSMCSGNKLKLLSGADETATYLWNDGSGLPYLPLSTAGEYSVTVTNNRGCQAIDSIQIDIHGIAPIANFAANPVCLTHPTQFTDLSSSPDGSNIISYVWNFGVQGSATSQNPVFTYPGPGEFEANLRIMTENNCAEEITHTVRVYALPQPNFTPLQTCSNTTVNFISNSTSNDGLITSYHWVFNNSGLSSDSIGQYLFTETGTFPVKHTTETQYGCSDSITKMVNVRPGPVVDFDYTSLCEGENVHFTNRSTSFLNMPVTLQWFVNDSLVSSISNLNYLFNQNGNVKITLAVKQNINGCEGTKTEVLSINRKPVANIEPQTSCLSDNYTLTDNSFSTDGSITKYFWDIEGIGYYFGKNPTMYFSDTGKYNIKLMVTSETGCSDTSYSTLEVFPLPIPSFNYSPRLLVSNEPIAFIDLSEGADSICWNFGDGNTSIGKDVYHTYSDSGRYTLNLVVYNRMACVDSIQTSLRVIHPLVDVEIIKTNASFTEGILEVSCQIANWGTIPLTEMTLDLQLSDGTSVVETWTGQLLPGSSVQYPFKAKFRYSELTRPSYLCIEATPISNYTDLNETNNTLCYTFTTDFELYDLYPNPASEEVNIDFNLPFVSVVKIEFLNSLGGTVHVFKPEGIKKGFNRIKFNARELGKGLFICRVSFKDKQTIKRIWVDFK